MPRYIDADEVLETMRSNIDMQELYLPTHFIDLVINDIPAADVQPVKHGRWIDNGGNMWLCSYCKENLIYSETESDREKKQRYCSRCGARMDGDNDGKD